MERPPPRLGEARASRPLLLFGALGGAVAWALRLVTAYPMVRVACRRGSTLPLWLLSAVALAVTLAAFVVCWRALRREPQGGSGLPAAAHEPARFLAYAGLLMNPLFALLIAGESLPIALDELCRDVDLSPSTVTPDAVGLLLGLLLPGTARADTLDFVPTPREVWRIWSFEPGVLLSLGAAALAYRQGLRRLWRRAGGRRALPRRRARCFWAGMAVLGVALVSPVDTLGVLLFSTHMAQHLLLVVVAAPLLAAGAATGVWTWALPASTRARLRRLRRSPGALGRGLGLAQNPLVAALAHALAVWVWHLPRLYEAALEYESLHALQHASFLLTALLLWSAVFSHARTDSGLALVAVFLTALQGAVLGALITVVPTQWFPAHAAGTPGWTLTPLEDQQLAGLLMWVPGSVLYVAAAVVLARRWMSASTLSANAHAPARRLVLPKTPVRGVEL